MAIRKQIQDYLDIRDKIDQRVNAVLNKNLSIDSIPEGEERNMIKLTVATVARRQKYLFEKLLYKEAIMDYKVNFGSNMKAVQIVARKYKLHPPSLSLEIHKHTLSEPNYVFDKNIEGEDITYAQEEELWVYSKLLAKTEFIPCTCRACFLLESSLHVYECLDEWEVDEKYRLWYLVRRASIEWIKKFEMMHRYEISGLCKSSCNGIYGVALFEEPVEPVSKKRCM